MYNTYIHCLRGEWEIRIISFSWDRSASFRLICCIYVTLHISRRPIRFVVTYYTLPFGVVIRNHPSSDALYDDIVCSYKSRARFWLAWLAVVVCSLSSQQRSRHAKNESVRPRALVTVCLHVNTVHKYNWIQRVRVFLILWSFRLLH